MTPLDEIAAERRRQREGCVNPKLCRGFRPGRCATHIAWGRYCDERPDGADSLDPLEAEIERLDRAAEREGRR